MKIAVVDIQKNEGIKAAETLVESGGVAKFFHVGLSSKDDIFCMVDEVASEFGSIDLLINNGRAPRKNSKDQFFIDEGAPLCLSCYQPPTIVRSRLCHIFKKQVEESSSMFHLLFLRIFVVSLLTITFQKQGSIN